MPAQEGVPGPGQQEPQGPGPMVPGPEGWQPAPPGHQPPVGWIPTEHGWEPAPPGWAPPPWWVQTPSGYLPPPQQPAPPVHPVPAGWARLDSGPDAAVRGFGWPRVLPRTSQLAARRGDRKPSGWEIVIVLAVFPASAVVAALLSLSQTLANYSDGSAHAPDLVPNHVAVSTILFVLLELTEFAPAFLVLYLLKLSGGGARALGLDRTQPRTDLARSGKVLLYCFAIPILVGSAALSRFTPHGALAGADSTTLPIAYLVPLVLSSVSAGVVEEIVVLGFLVHRLEQRGWSGWRLYAVCIAVRMSYHLYYGFPVLGFGVWAGLMVMFYRRRRRLLTFIAAHVLWDTSAFITSYLHGGYEVLPYVVEILFALGLWMWGAWGDRGAVAEEKASGAAIAQGRDEIPDLA